MKLRALSLDCAILSLWSESSWSGHVHSCFDGALNLLDDAGNLITLLNRRKVDGPHRMIVETPPNFSFRECNLKVDALFIKNELSLSCIPHLLIDTSVPAAWSERWPPGDVKLSLAEIRRNIFKVAEFLFRNSGDEEKYLINLCIDSFSKGQICDAGGVSALYRHLSTAYADLTRGVRFREQEAAKAGIKKLIGLGKGLTPSGDDIITGFVNALFFIERCDSLNNEFTGELLSWCRLLGESEELNTPLISRKLLQLALSGRISQEVMMLCEHLTGLSEESFEECGRQFLTSGSSSGREIMLGVLTGFAYLAPPHMSSAVKRGTSASDAKY